jgi:hypothetical protein
VSQFEKLWVDMTALPEVQTRYAVVPRARGQQLKDQAQLDGWLRDGSAAHVAKLCAWGRGLPALMGEPFLMKICHCSSLTPFLSPLSRSDNCFSAQKKCGRFDKGGNWDIVEGVGG